MFNKGFIRYLLRRNLELFDRCGIELLEFQVLLNMFFVFIFIRFTGRMDLEKRRVSYMQI